MKERSALPRADQQVPSKKIPEFQFRGVWVPPRVCELLRGRDINATDLTLLILIDSFSHPGGRGCFASNKYLAGVLGLTTSPVKRGLAKLLRLGLIVTAGVREGRTLRTAWSSLTDMVNKSQVGAQEAPTLGAFSSPQKRDRREAEEHSGRTAAGVCRSSSAQGVPPMLNGDVQEVLVDMGVNNPVKKKVVPTPLDKECAEWLRRIVIQKARRTTKWSRLDWSREFRILRESLDLDAERRIRDVLAWYEENIGGDYTPVSWCGQSFRKKFDRLEGAMLRDQRRNPVAREVSPEAVGVARRLAMKGWPKGCEANLPAVVQMSITSLEAFCSRLQDVASQTGWVGKVAAKALRGELSDPPHYIEQWLESVHHRLRGWDGWSGSLGDFTFRPDRKEFLAAGRGWAERYCGDPAVWDRVLKEVGRGAEA